MKGMNWITDRYIVSILALASLLSSTTAANILVVGSINADTFLPVSRLPAEGENLMLWKDAIVDVPGGKGCTQAVAASKLCSSASRKVAFAGQFGNDEAAAILRRCCEDANVLIPSLCQRNHEGLPSGRGYVFITESGSVSAVVSGGSNEKGWKAWERAWNTRRGLLNIAASEDEDGETVSSEDLDQLFSGVTCVMLQREIPEYVNMLVATEARKRGEILVLQDIGGDDREISRDQDQKR